MCTGSSTLPGQTALLQRSAVPALVQQALTSKPEQTASLDCLVALAKASPALQQPVLGALVPAALQRLRSDSAAQQQPQAVLQLLDAITEGLLPACTGDESAPALLHVAQAALRAADETGGTVSPAAAAALARLTAAATAACPVEGQQQLAASAARHLHSGSESAHQTTLVSSKHHARCMSRYELPLAHSVPWKAAHVLVDVFAGAAEL